MSHENHDDGLVHGHRWATEPSRRPLPTTIPAPEERDDGLVHSHGWACAERSRMAGQA